MQTKNWHLRVLSAVVVVLMLAACAGGSNGGGKGAQGQSSAGDTLRIGWGLGPLTLDPPNESGIGGIGVLHNVYQTLVSYDFNTGSVVPSLAEKWEVSGNGLSYTFQLNPDATFADGTPVTSQDVKFSFDRVLKWTEAVQGYQIRPSLTNATIETPDNKTVKITLAQPFGGFLAALTGTSASIISSAQVLKAGSSEEAQRAWLAKNIAGSGPYTLDKWAPNSSLTLSRNKNYWGKKPLYQSVQIEFMTESSQQVAGLRKGDLDVALDVLPKQADELVKAGGFTANGGSDLATYYLGLNMGVKPFDDERVREAVRYAIDYNGIIDGLLNGRAVKAGGVVAKGLLGYDPSLDSLYTHDVKRARELLAEAGLANGFSFDLYLANDTVKGLGVPTSSLATKIQSDLAQVGITANLHTQDINALFPSYRAGKIPAIVWYFGPTYPDPDPIVSPHGAWDAPNTARLNFKNPVVNEQIKKARALVDSNARAGLYQVIGKEVAKSGPYVFLFRPQGYVVARKGVEGVRWVPIWTLNLS